LRADEAAATLATASVTKKFSARWKRLGAGGGQPIHALSPSRTAKFELEKLSQMA
jgi:hypothetical protein